MVSIILLSYNTKDLLKSCLDSVYSSLKDTAFEVIVVDNASLDNSLAMVRSEFKSAICIQNARNVGFAAGVNIGARRAKGDYLLLLNSDTQMKKNGLEKALAFLESNPKVAVVGAVLENKSGVVEASYGNFPNPFSALTARKKIESNPPVAPLFVDWVNGAYMLIKKDVFDLLHGFDERFFMYVEDIEFCYRIHKKGYKVVVIPDVRVYHKGQGSANPSFAIIQIYKGLQYFFKKHKNTVEYILATSVLALKAIGVIGIGFLFGKKDWVVTYTAALKSIL